jgi:hypothetical protein
MIFTDIVHDQSISLLVISGFSEQGGSEASRNPIRAWRLRSDGKRHGKLSAFNLI